MNRPLNKSKERETLNYKIREERCGITTETIQYRGLSGTILKTHILIHWKISEKWLNF